MSSFDTELSSRLAPGLLPYLSAAGDVVHGRTPLVDTASRGGWGAIDALGAIFALAPLGYGTLALAVSAAAAACALLVLTLAIYVVRPRAAAVAIGMAAGLVGSLAGPLADAAAPSSGALTLMIALLGVVAAVLGSDRVRWRRCVPLICALGVLWSAPAAALTLAAVAAGSSGWPVQARHGLARRCAVACAAAIAAYAAVAVLRSGALPDPRLILATSPFGASPGEPEASSATLLLALVAALSLGVACWAWRGAAAASAPARTVSAVRATAALAGLLATHGLIVRAPVEIEHAAGLALLLAGIVARTRGARGTALFAISLMAVLACAGPTIVDRFRTSALYAAIPHQPFDALHVGGGAFGRSLRYDLRVLASNPLLTPEGVLVASPLIPAVTRRGDRVLVVLPGPQQAESLAFVGRGGLLALGDPTTNAVVGQLRGRLRDAVDVLPDRARILTREDWLGEALAGAAPATDGDDGPRQALRLVLERFEAHVTKRSGGLVVAELLRRQTTAGSWLDADGGLAGFNAFARRRGRVAFAADAISASAIRRLRPRAGPLRRDGARPSSPSGRPRARPRHRSSGRRPGSH